MKRTLEQGEIEYPSWADAPINRKDVSVQLHEYIDTRKLYIQTGNSVEI